jgi:hypothetical protein
MMWRCAGHRKWIKCILVKRAGGGGEVTVEEKQESNDGHLENLNGRIEADWQCSMF